MRCYAVIDTDVLVSALISSHDDAATVQVVNKLFTAEFIPLYSKAIMDEYSNVLHRKKFHFSDEAINDFLLFIKQNGILINPNDSGEILPDMKDLPFYEAVLEKQREGAYLVTENVKHFPHKPFVVTPNKMLEILGN